MKKNFYKNILKIFVLILIGIFFNFYIDSYGIFKKNLNYQILEPNKNYLKTKYIIENINKYDSFIFGSSRVGNIPTEIIKGNKFYNMTFSEGLPQEWLKALSIFLNEGSKINTVILGLDDISFKVIPESHFLQPMRLPYYKLENKKDLVKNYILKNPLNKYNLITLYQSLKRNWNNYYKEFYTSGRSINTAKDLWIEKNKDLHRKNKIFLKSDYGNMDFIRVGKTLNEIEQISELYYKNDINLIIIINPLHKMAYIKNNLKEYQEIKKEIFKIKNCKIYDFSELNEITLDNYYWYETSHFRPIVGEMMLKKIYQDKIDLDIEVPEYFGRFKNNYELK